jgi:hypothetical protein
MKVTRHKKTLSEVLSKIEYLIFTYYEDMRNFADMPGSQFFKFMSHLVQYVPDPAGFELIMRPRFLLEFMGGDCDDKAIASCSYFLCKKITTGYAIVSDKEDKPFHHIFCIFSVGGVQYDFDCTYPHNQYLERRQWARRKEKIIYQGAL